MISARSIVGRLLPLLILSSLLPGCVSYWRGQEMQADLAGLQGQVDLLKENQQKQRQKMATNLQRMSAEFQRMNEQLLTSIQAVQSGAADTGLVLEELKSKYAEAQGKLEELQRQQAEASEPIVQPIERPNAPALPTEAAPLYKYGYDKKREGDCTEAVRAFATFYRKFKKHQRADSSLYLMADCQTQQGDNTGAIQSLQVILKRYSKGKKVDDALLLMHDNFQALGRCKDAIVFLEDLIADYPSSKPAKKARKKLARARKKCR